MWVVTDEGFYSIVHKPYNPEGVLTVRARCREDLEQFCAQVKSASEITDDVGADYRFRVTADQKETGEWLAKKVGEIRYDNFKNHIGETQGWGRERVYANVWRELLALKRLKD